ncbi:hypothetical protein LTR97_011809 [Elasticomyces elasticus]|uniref:Uncharacterized protein n=1 Tax=Elasticomyces elasticus TaxID=574655 RepID=A0AAN7VYL7_9PEZI|nr:hypothetical protein LTR97_011809 [Elasticomyces elasticus]
MANMDIPAVPIRGKRISIGTYEGNLFWSTVTIRYLKDGKTTYQIVHIYYDPSSNKPMSVNRELLRDVVLNDGLCDFMDEQVGGKWQKNNSADRNCKVKMVAEQVLAKNPKLVVHLGSNLFGGIYATPTPAQVEAALAHLQSKSGLPMRTIGDDNVGGGQGGGGGQVTPASEPQNFKLADTGQAPAHRRQLTPALTREGSPRSQHKNVVTQDAPSTGSLGMNANMPSSNEVETLGQRGSPSVGSKRVRQHETIDLTATPSPVIKQENSDVDHELQDLKFQKRKLALDQREFELDIQE